MTAAELLSHLAKLDISLRADNGQLIVSGRRGIVTPELRSALLERKPELLALLAGGADPTTRQEPALRPVSRNGALPLSFAQRRLWFLNQYEPQNPFYNIPVCLHLRGSLNLPALEQSLDEIVRRHEALRTTFSVAAEEPAQIIAAPAHRPLAVIDYTGDPPSGRRHKAERHASEEAARPFDLTRGPLFRAILLRFGDNEHYLLLTFHHIVADGWSVGVFYRELSALYDAYSRAETSPLADLPIQYADYAVWQREWFAGEILQSQLAYWKKHLADISGLLNLPTDRPRPAVQSFRGARYPQALSRELIEALKRLGREEGATLFMTLLAAFQTLLHRYTGECDIVVGSPIANRIRPEIENLIGFFANTLVLRTSLLGSPTFRELLRRVRQTALEAYDHQDLPFEKLVEELNPERNLSHSPLFQVLFVLQNVPPGPRNLAGITMDTVKLENHTTKFDLTLSMSEQPDGLKGSWEYSADLFDPATVTRMAGHFGTLLESIAADPDRPVRDLPMLAPAERRQLVTEWNETGRPYPQSACVHELFEIQVRRTPERVAVIFEGRQLTYAELNCRANRLARTLMKRGVGTETLVGICVERSLDLVIGLLGILKAGATYVPLDPCFPRERLAFMCEDTRLPFLLSQRHLLESLPPFAGTVLYLEEEGDGLPAESGDNIAGPTSAENLAYVIYTSGSTGRPKGVQITHQAVVNVLSHMQDELRPGARDTALLLANVCFDISVLELMLPLISGARLVIADAATVMDGKRIGQLLSDHCVTILHATPATWRLLLLAGWTPPAHSIILCGGEALTMELASQLASNGSSVRNLYGPTETTIYSSAAEYCAGSPRATVSIGRPLRNTQIYILDAGLQPVPVGVPGQLCIAGDGLARGYLHRPDVTADSFIPNPFSATAGERLYKTGDLARYLPDGSIEYLGRMDHQVKLRGFRVEPGEIEAVLSEHERVRQSVVVAREDLAGERELIAYVVSEHGTSANEDDLRCFLKTKLPEYMIPGAFVFLASLPRTANGKLDRSALPAPDPGSRRLPGNSVPPQTPLESLVADIWSEVLKLDSIGIHDNFFELGGHSLKATQVISRVRETFQVDVPVRILFEAPSVAEFTLKLREKLVDSGALEELERCMAEIDTLSGDEARPLRRQ